MGRIVRFRRGLKGAALLLLVATGLSACAVPLKIERRDDFVPLAPLNEFILEDGDLSYVAKLVLQTADLATLWEDDPDEALRQLHRRAEGIDTRINLYALSELSFARGLDTDDRDHYLAAAVYAWYFLFGEADQNPPDGFAPMFRWACQIYDMGISRGFLDEPGGNWVPEAGDRRLPIGTVRVEVEEGGFQVGGLEFDRFIPADEFVIRGMRGRVRGLGIGAPLLARSTQKERPSGASYFPPNLTVPGTALLRLGGEFRDLSERGADAVLELHSPYAGDRTTEIRGRTVPLETELSMPLAASLGDRTFLSFETSAFFGGTTAFENGLLLLAPYQPGKVPVVFVHGTASTPTYWAELLNELMRDPEIRQRCQFWLYIYRSGAPVLASAADLRDAVCGALRAFDPQGADPALREMVVVGHSQGGLLTRLLATSSGDRFWKNANSKVAFQDAKLDDDDRKELERALFFEPLPSVRRVVFLATPHRGSFLSEGLVRTLGSWLAGIPKRTIDLTQRLTAKGLGPVLGFEPGTEVRMPTSVDNMAPNSPFCMALADLPIAPGVQVHSVIGALGEGPLEEQDDGVVAYTSAHLDVGTEVVVRSPHSLQGHPRTVAEVRRILRAHLAGAPAPR